MDGNIVGLAAVVMIFGIPMAAMYTFFRVRRLRSEERLAAIARGIEVPMQPELSEAARSRRAGILLVAGAIGYIVTFALIGRVEPDAMIAATFGVIPLSVGVGFFIDHALIRRDAKA
jgi:preprotein translocase subunit Sss1